MGGSIKHKKIGKTVSHDFKLPTDLQSEMDSLAASVPAEMRAADWRPAPESELRKKHDRLTELIRLWRHGYYEMLDQRR